MEYEGDSDSSCGQCTRDNPERIGKGIVRQGKKRKTRGYNIIKISRDTQESPGDLRRLLAINLQWETIS